jgi:hypothetical protein
MSAPPLRTALSDVYPNPTNATLRTGLGAFWDYVTGLLGATGNAVDARTALGLGATSVPTFAGLSGLQIAGRRSAVINGNGLIQQIPAPTLTAALQYGAADMHMIGVTGGTGVSGTAGVLANAGFSCGVGYGAIAASWTGGQFIHKHRMPGINTKKYNGKTVTVSGKIYQDTGGSRNITVSLGKPTTTLDTFSAVTNLGTSSAIPVASATVTPFSLTLTLGATDASLGLEILTTDNAANTVSNKNYAISDLQIEPGTNVSTFEQPDEFLELQVCRTFFPVFRCTGSGGFETLPGSCSNYSAATAYYVPAFNSQVRARLTGILVSDVTKFSVSDVALGLANTTNIVATANGSLHSTMVTVSATITANLPSIFGFRTTATANDYIAFTGAQL